MSMFWVIYRIFLSGTFTPNEIFGSGSSNEGAVDKQDEEAQNEECKKSQMQSHAPPGRPINRRMAISVLVHVTLKLESISSKILREITWLCM